MILELTLKLVKKNNINLKTRIENNFSHFFLFLLYYILKDRMTQKIGDNMFNLINYLRWLYMLKKENANRLIFFYSNQKNNHGNLYVLKENIEFICYICWIKKL